MINDKHTPEWTACHRSWGWDIVNEEFGYVASVNLGPKAEALAVFIQDACNRAPLLIECREVIEGLIHLPVNDDGERIIPAGFLDDARALLAKLGE